MKYNEKMINFSLQDNTKVKYSDTLSNTGFNCWKYIFNSISQI